jgi:hypothetical protein
MRKKTANRSVKKSGSNSVKVVQKARARSGQGGNVYAINSSDVGVIRTDIQPK